MRLSLKQNCGVALAFLLVGVLGWQATETGDVRSISSSLHEADGALASSAFVLPDVLPEVIEPVVIRETVLSDSPHSLETENVEVEEFDVRNHCIVTKAEATEVLLAGCFAVATGSELPGDFAEEWLVVASNTPEIESEELSEESARSVFMQAFGGELQYVENESPLERAHAAARRALQRRGINLHSIPHLAVIDFTVPSNARRLSLWNPRTGEESRYLVAHGMGSGDHYAHHFSNTAGSYQSSPGLYRVGSRYDGAHGTSLRLQGLEPGVNDQAAKRVLVLHSAWYVSYKTILENLEELGVPRIGRSHGCPAVSHAALTTVLEKLSPGSYLYIHANPLPTFPQEPNTQTIAQGPRWKPMIRRRPGAIQIREVRQLPFVKGSTSETGNETSDSTGRIASALRFWKKNTSEGRATTK
jgi:hypothetical protein